MVKFVSEPPGAAVLVNGRLVCPSTPCSKQLPEGTVQVEFQLMDYLPQTLALQVEKGAVGEAELAPDFALVQFSSDVSGLVVELNESISTSTGAEPIRLAPGSYKAFIQDECYEPVGLEFSVKRVDHL